MATLADKVKERSLAVLVNKNFTFNYKKFRNFLDNHSYFIDNFCQEIKDFVLNHSEEKPSAKAISFLYEQNSRALELVEGIKGTFSDGITLNIADLIISLSDMYNTLLAALIMQGLNEDKGFEINKKYTEYIVNKDESLDSIARTQLGSVDKIEDLLIANPWIFSCSREQLLGKVLLIPDVTVSKNALTVNVGKNSWGRDLPDLLETVDGDLLILDEDDTLNQTVNNILKYPRNSVPEDPRIGNPLIEAIGQDVLSVDDVLKSLILKEVLETDPAIEEAQVTDIEPTVDKVTASVYIKPLNSDEVRLFKYE